MRDTGNPQLPEPPEGGDEPWYKRWRAIAVVGLVVIGGLMGCATADVEPDTTPSPTPTTTSVDVPDVVGMPWDEARTALRDAGLQPRRRVMDSTDHEPDTVMRTSPGPGRSVDEGRQVSVVTASAPEPPPVPPPAPEPPPGYGSHLDRDGDGIGCE